jgi:putative transposase
LSSQTQILSFKTKLDPNNVQKTLLSKAAGTARFAYNWGLNYQIENYSGGTKTYIKDNELRKIFNEIKKEEFPWTKEVTKCSPQQALKDLDNAFKRFWESSLNSRRKEKVILFTVMLIILDWI